MVVHIEAHLAEHFAASNAKPMTKKSSVLSHLSKIIFSLIQPTKSRLQQFLVNSSNGVLGLLNVTKWDSHLMFLLMFLLHSHTGHELLRVLFKKDEFTPKNS